jgi:hypothetical protein
MTTGALIFAFNNSEIDYLAMAAWSAERIRRHLNIPVAVVTDSTGNIDAFDKVIHSVPEGSGIRHFTDFGTNVVWHNANRTTAYELTPWDRTLVLDADYVVAGNQLEFILRAQQDFLCHRLAYDVTGLQTFDDLNYFGRNRMPMHWATVMMFSRSITAELIFGSMQMIRENWKHYCTLYGNPRSTYRNDHALSIALNIVNGHVLRQPDIAWSLASVTPEHELVQTDTDQFRVNYQTAQSQRKWIELKGQDFHAMGKRTLMDIVAHA